MGLAPVALKATTLGEMTQNSGHLTVQELRGHHFWYQSKAHM